MEKLKKAYEALEMLETLGLQVSDEQRRQVRNLEHEYVETEVIPLIKQYVEPLLTSLRSSFMIRMHYDKEEGLNITLNKSESCDGEAVQRVMTTSRQTSTDRYLIRVVFPDGHVICHRKVLDTLVDVVEYAGAEEVRALNIHTVVGNLIGNELSDNERYAASQKELSTGEYIVTYSNTETKYRQIMEINKRLNLKLEVSKVLLR